MNRLNERLALIVVVLLLIFSRQSTPELQVGDILFQDLDCGPPCEAIEAVTSGYNGAQLSHNGIITEIKGNKFSQIFVVEAIGERVVKTPLDNFLKRSNKVIVGRLKPDYTYMISDAINYIENSILGKPYDYIFDLENDTYYARIRVKCKDQLIEIDARPSDAIALSVRTKSPIFVDSDVFERACINIDQEDNVIIDNNLKQNKDNQVSDEELQKLSAFQDFVSELDMNLSQEDEKPE